MRVGIIGLAHESNTFATTPTTLDDFERIMLIMGPRFGREFKWKHHEVSGFFNTLHDAGIESVPIFMASATPSGPIAQETASTLLQSLFQEVEKAGTLDGYLVAPHGAAVAEHIPDFDGYWLTELRKRVGQQVPIISTLDPHANVSAAMVSMCNAFIAYRTNPHIDQYQCGARAADLMIRTLRGEVKPVTASAFPGIAINVERQFTEAEPCKSLYRLGDAISSQPGVLSTSVILGFPYADVPEMGSGFLVVMDKDVDRGQNLADDWAAELYRRRDDFIGKLIDVDQAIDQALSGPGPVCLLDMGDNVGGGGPADSTFVLAALHRRKIKKSFVCLCDPDCAAAAWSAGPGASITLEMGGKTDRGHGSSVQAAVSVLSLHEGKFSEPRPRHGAKSDFDMGKTVLVLTGSGVTVMLTSLRTFPVSIIQLTSCGLDPGSFQILVAKGVHAPVAGYSEVCDTFIRANTPGITTADMMHLTYHRRRRPLFPFEQASALH